MNSPLEKLAGPSGPLAAEAPNDQEIAGLLRSGRARLADAANATLALESRFDLAYNAAHALCLAAVRCMGYRAKHRYIVFQALPHTLGLGPEVWRVLDKAHQLRNLAEYEGHVDVDERLVIDVIGACGLIQLRLEQSAEP